MAAQKAYGHTYGHKKIEKEKPDRVLVYVRQNYINKYRKII